MDRKRRKRKSEWRKFSRLKSGDIAQFCGRGAAEVRTTKGLKVRVLKGGRRR